MGGVDEVIPVDAHIPGCPPRPEAIIDGVVKLLSNLKNPSATPALESSDGALDSRELAL